MTVVDSVPKDLLIGGEWRPGSTGERIEVLDPATGDPIASVAAASVDDGLAAVTAAYDAMPAWAATPPRERAEVLRRAWQLLVDQTDRIAELMVRENGKALPDAVGEVAYAAEFMRWFAEEAVRIEGRIGTAPGGDKRIVVMQQPVGVSVLVTPWNFPASMATRKIGPALAAGCSVVLKPASSTPLTALAVGELLGEAGVPAGVVNVIPTRGGAVVSALLRDPRVRKLSFTGSTEVGRVLLAEAAECVVNHSMELGGNAPFVVFEDADIGAAVAGAMVAKMRNGGEACTAANRFFVHEAVAEEFASGLSDAMAGLRMGPGMEPGVELGPLVDAPTRDKVDELVVGALDAGARARTGGSRPDGPGFFYPPTVLDHVGQDSPILEHEIFGPVAPVVTFGTEDEAIKLANDTEFGLVAYVYTGDLARGMRVAEAIESGMVGINRGLVSDPAAPFGGVKQSGIGREGGHEGIQEYLETKYIAANW